MVKITNVFVHPPDGLFSAAETALAMFQKRREFKLV